MRSKFKDEHPFGKRRARSHPMPTQLGRRSLIKKSNPRLSDTITEKRKAEAERIRQKYPDRIPVST